MDELIRLSIRQRQHEMIARAEVQRLVLQACGRRPLRYQLGTLLIRLGSILVDMPYRSWRNRGRVEEYTDYLDEYGELCA